MVPPASALSYIENYPILSLGFYSTKSPTSQLDEEGGSAFMATLKQMKMLAARAAEAGMELDFESTKELTNGDVDAKIKEIEEFAAKPKEASAEKAAAPKTELNGFRFGMAYKIVREKYSGYEIKTITERFIRDVVDEYNLTMKAEEAVLASSGDF